METIENTHFRKKKNMQSAVKNIRKSNILLDFFCIYTYFLQPNVRVQIVRVQITNNILMVLVFRENEKNEEYFFVKYWVRNRTRSIKINIHPESSCVMILSGPSGSDIHRHLSQSILTLIHNGETGWKLKISINLNVPTCSSVLG